MCLFEFERSLQRAGTSFKAWERNAMAGNGRLSVIQINQFSWKDLIMNVPWSGSLEGEEFWDNTYDIDVISTDKLENTI